MDNPTPLPFGPLEQSYLMASPQQRARGKALDSLDPKYWSDMNMYNLVNQFGPIAGRAKWMLSNLGKVGYGRTDAQGVQ